MKRNKLIFNSTIAFILLITVTIHQFRDIIESGES